MSRETEVVNWLYQHHLVHGRIRGVQHHRCPAPLQADQLMLAKGGSWDTDSIHCTHRRVCEKGCAEYQWTPVV